MILVHIIYDRNVCYRDFAITDLIVRIYWKFRTAMTANTRDTNYESEYESYSQIRYSD